MAPKWNLKSTIAKIQAGASLTEVILKSSVNKALAGHLHRSFKPETLSKEHEPKNQSKKQGGKKNEKN
jgi:hypothetical protein